MDRAPVGAEPTAVLPDASAPPTFADRPADPPEPATVADRPSGVAASAAPSRRTTPPPSATITTVAEALRDEEVHRTRLFIRLGWGASVAGLGTIPFVDSARWMVLAFAGALVLGMVVSFGFHQAFRDPRRYGPRALFALGVMSTINTHVAILFYGAFSLAPVLIVIGMHFIGRSELAARRAVIATSAGCHALITVALASGAIADPGVFASSVPLGTEAYLLGAIYVQGAYALAYATGRSQRQASLRAIEQLQRATRIDSQRAALLEELRLDLARAQQGGAGRYTDQVVGGYRLGHVIGRGAHGEVYEATPDDGGDPVAIKVLHREHLGDPTLVARFLREVEATRAIASPHVVRVVATGAADAPVPYYVMERLRGQTLADVLRRAGRLSADDAVALVTQAAAALDAAHAVGIVHRDLKPQNLFGHGGTWKLLDFGVAALASQGGTLTVGGLVGTPAYMAPEQAKGERVDPRTDLYALGVTAYRVLTGRNAFGGPDTPAILYAVVHTMPLRPTSLAQLPDDVDRWAAIALAKDPAARFATGDELARALALALRGALPAGARAAGDRLIDALPWQEAA